MARAVSRPSGSSTDDRVRSTAGQELLVAWVGAVVFVAISVPVVWKGIPAGQNGEIWGWLIQIFPVLGVLAWISALKQTRAWFRFGRGELLLDPVPGSVGGHAGGHLDVPVRLEDGQVWASLSCMEIKPRSGDSNDLQRVIWTRNQRPRLEPGPHRGTRIRFTFEIPDELPASVPPGTRLERTADDSTVYHRWIARVSADIPGVDLDRAFEIPIVADDTPRLAASPALPEEAEKAMDPVRALSTLPGGLVRMDPEARGFSLYFPPGRNPAMSLLLTLFGSVFLIPSLFLGRFFWDTFGGELDGFSVLFAVMAAPIFLVFFTLGLLILLFGLGALLGTRTTYVSRDTFRSHAGLLGIPFPGRTMAVDDVEHLEVAPDGQMGSGAKYHVFHSIRALPIPGRGQRPLQLATAVRGIDAASTLARGIAAEAGVEFREVSRKARRGPWLTRQLERKASQGGQVE